MKKSILFMKRAAVGLAVAAATSPAFAAIPTEVETKMTEAAVDGAAMATFGLLVIVAIAAVKYLRGAK